MNTMFIANWTFYMGQTSGLWTNLSGGAHEMFVFALGRV